jgi:hypothetical protein
MVRDQMATPRSDGPDFGEDDDEVTDFMSLLHELKTKGCNLLVAGAARPDLFTRASASLLGDPETVRNRLLAATDVSPRTVVERLPDQSESPRPLAETTRIVNHAATPRSVTATPDPNAPAGIADIPETKVVDPGLEGLETALVDGIDALCANATNLRPAELRVCLDSLGSLLDHYETDVVRRCLRTVGERVRENRGMAHYLLKEHSDSERVQTLAEDVDAVIEIRSVNPESHDHEAQQRWHVPDRNLTTDWVRL